MDRRRFLVGASSILAGSGLVSMAKPALANASSNIDSLKDKALKKIAFGSCNRQSRAQTHWSVIEQDRPDLWIWLGDNIYGDGLSLQQRAEAWTNLKFDPNYYSLMQKTATMGTWDDHDYASNNQGKNFPDKEQSQEQFADFLGVPGDHPMRLREGVYYSETFGPYGKQTQVIMLDLRYFRGNPRYESMLGEEQWDWFENELRSSTADLIIIGSSVHLTSGITGFGLEGWNQYPKERQRLYEELEAIDVPILVLSGDRHMAEFTKRTLRNGKPIYEFMSSGLTHSTYAPLPDSGRIGRVIGSKNYGLINIDWTSQGPQLGLQIKDATRQGVAQQITPSYAYS
ncbi:alkaline phosphatase D family protein [Pseudobacteriovorax antillogorgiicola]|uniref:Alkaline phosphatase D n=1 Tax=Pseudobacteriovorax antillogorgiicola TaxID=1513793 RepID=A0A1Y6BM80_9BACT|nr:alkaline phosphatase D family protein [Pseudobacteriovorax antillogorgiicola]TCS56251.1 alkaline phosphatase D [Pseudobacteriovorax antillogorgiicola]SMF07998.1 alkaline phosphatase D [Pseudobacteriovorax antillogorgiicola]